MQCTSKVQFDEIYESDKCRDEMRDVKCKVQFDNLSLSCLYGYSTTFDTHIHTMLERFIG